LHCAPLRPSSARQDCDWDALQDEMGIIFTNADPRYAGRFDDKQGGGTIVTMERVRDAIAFNAELADESTWLWLTSKQMGFPLRPTGGGEHEERAEDSDSSLSSIMQYFIYFISCTMVKVSV